jgi:hypothetical protein
MSETMVTVKVKATLPYRNGRFVPHLPGDVVSLNKLTEAVVKGVSSDDRLLKHVLESA